MRLAAVAWVVGCGHSPAPAAVEVPPSYGVLAPGTVVRTAARPDAPGLKLRERTTVRVGELVDGEVEVRTNVPVPCTAVAYSGLDLVLFAHRSDFELVTRRPTERRFPDGTAIELAAGVPLSPAAGGRYTVAVGDAELSITAPPLHVGRRFEDAPRFDPGDTRLPADVPAYVDGVAIESIRNVVAAARDTRVTLVDRCLQLHAIVPIEAAVASRDASAQQPGRPVPMALAAAPEDYAVVEAGTPVTWPDGTAAGTALVRVPIGTGAGTPRGDRLCFGQGRDAAAEFMLCAAADAVESVPAYAFDG